MKSGVSRFASAAVLALGLLGPGQLVLADNELPAGIVGVRYPDSDEAAPSSAAGAGSTPAVATSSSGLPVVPLYTKKSGDTTSYSDIGRGFKLLRPFGFNEFEGAGGGYLVKFASLFDVDENVVVGSAPATAGKTSITQYGELRELGEKLAKKRGGDLLEATARSTEGVDYYAFKFSSPLDPSLPRPGACHYFLLSRSYYFPFLCLSFLSNALTSHLARIVPVHRLKISKAREAYRAVPALRFQGPSLERQRDQQ